METDKMEKRPKIPIKGVFKGGHPKMRETEKMVFWQKLF